MVIVVVFSATVGYTASGGTFDYRGIIGPWLREIITFNVSKSMVHYMSQAPIGFKLHVLLAFTLFAV